MNLKNDTTRVYTKLIVVLALLTSTSLGQAFLVDISGLGFSTQAAHEELTRQSLKLATPYLQQTLPTIFSNEPQANNELETNIVLGAYATDFPKGRYPVDLFAYWGLPNNINPHTDYRISVLHATRNYIDSERTQLVSAFETCEQIKRNLTKVTVSILEKLKDENKIPAYFLIGHALHTIQDSFSTAHLNRRESSKDNYDVVDICHYTGNNEPKEPSICFHHKVDHRDNIWLINDAKVLKHTQREWGPLGQKAMAATHIKTPSDLTEFDIYEIADNEREHYLTHEARLAKVAGARYLIAVAKLATDLNTADITAQQDLIGAFLKSHFFEGNMNTEFEKTIMPKGVLRCEGLKN